MSSPVLGRTGLDPRDQGPILRGGRLQPRAAAVGDSPRRLEEQQAPLRIEPGEPPRPRIAGHALVVARRVVAEQRQAEAVLAVRLAMTRTRVAAGPRQDRHHVLREIPASFRPGEDRHPARRLFVPQRRPDVATPGPSGRNAPCPSTTTIPAGSARQATFDVRSTSPPRGPTPRAINWRLESPGASVIEAGLTRNLERSCRDGSRRRDHSRRGSRSAPGAGSRPVAVAARAATHRRNRAPR